MVFYLTPRELFIAKQKIITPSFYKTKRSQMCHFVSNIKVYTHPDEDSKSLIPDEAIKFMALVLWIWF